MKNPEVVKAVDAWSTTNLPKVMGSVVHDMNQAISSGQVGQVTPQEIQSYKAMAPNFVTNMFDKMKGKNKKFEVKPSPAALQAASKAVAAEIKSMPDVPAQPAQPVQQPQNPAQVSLAGNLQPVGLQYSDCQRPRLASPVGIGEIKLLAQLTQHAVGLLVRHALVDLPFQPL